MHWLSVALLVLWPLQQALVILLGISTTRATARRRRGLPTPVTGFTYWVIVPALNEERVVARTVGGILRMDGPRARVQVLVVDDGSDDGTAAALAAIQDPRVHVLRRDLPHARQGKGEALNEGYRLLRDQALRAGTLDRTIIGIIDGDGRPSSRMAQVVGTFFQDERVAAVQTRVRIHNRSHPLAMAQDLEFGSVASVAQTMRDKLGSVGLGGNGQWMRLSALAEMGELPWSNCLVEDLEIGLRMHLAGHRIRYVSAVAVTQQGVTDIRRLLRQRTRWAQGNLQCVRYVPMVVASKRITNRAMFEILGYLLAPWANVLGTFALAALLVQQVVSATLGRGPSLEVYASGPILPLAAAVCAVVALAPGLVWGLLHGLVLKDENWRRCLLAGLGYTLFVLIGVLATWRALGRQIRGVRGWAKTERAVETSAAAGPLDLLDGLVHSGGLAGLVPERS